MLQIFFNACYVVSCNTTCILGCGGGHFFLIWIDKEQGLSALCRRSNLTDQGI